MLILSYYSLVWCNCDFIMTSYLLRHGVQFGIFSVQYFLAFELTTEIYSVNLRIQSKYEEIRIRKNSGSGHLSSSAHFREININNWNTRVRCEICSKLILTIVQNIILVYLLLKFSQFTFFFKYFLGWMN